MNIQPQRSNIGNGRVIDLTFITGKITYDEISVLKKIDLSNQIDLLKEDMLQVDYQGTHLLDVGWYPSFDIKGSFQIRVIKDYNWDAPLVYSTAGTIRLLIEEINAAQNVINKEQ
ncbi:hypothetical protein [Pseudomonas sp. UMAB-40]|uniref:hypothetical protein n=1 Tax=Pseudomonas sp. UMAB-40 TaxID=1365407 RepID=UPI00214CE261|nr:hypothetical protein [Pseudomonas sp. UMAB-40]